MDEILLYLFFMLAAPIAVTLLLSAVAAERNRLEIYLEDKKTLDERIEKWRAMKRELRKWKEQEMRKAEERRLMKEKAMTAALKQLIS
jgi:anti-sigma factor RsiW